MIFVVLCPGTPEGSTGSGSGFKVNNSFILIIDYIFKLFANEHKQNVSVNCLQFCR